MKYRSVHHKVPNKAMSQLLTVFRILKAHNLQTIITFFIEYDMPV